MPRMTVPEEVPTQAGLDEVMRLLGEHDLVVWLADGCQVYVRSDYGASYVHSLMAAELELNGRPPMTWSVRETEAG